MAGQLTTQQVLLLNNLMYLGNNAPLRSIIDQDGNWSVGDIARSIADADLDLGKDYGSYMTGEDWKNLAQAILNDPELSSVRLAQTHISEPGGGASALFVNPSTNEAIVVYRGTGSGEWKDNFLGGGPTNQPDGVSTPYQQDALDWYESLDLSSYDSVTVTGHSKGGNKAKYVALMDDSVDRCLSFDGQGFSDEFYARYENRIIQRQGIIENHNVDQDYVNLLLNDIGQTYFYEGHDLGQGGFLENHCPNTFLRFDENGNPVMIPTERSSAMAALDDFLNSYLRHGSPEEKARRLDVIGNLVDIIFSSGDDFRMEDLLHYLLGSNDSTEAAADLLAYLSLYARDNPELFQQISGLFEDMGMGDVLNILDVVESILNWEHFDLVAGIIGFIGQGSALLLSLLPGWAVNWLLDLIERLLGIRFTEDELLRLLCFVGEFERARIEIGSAPNQGADLTLNSGSAEFSVEPDSLAAAGAELARIADQLKTYREEVKAVRQNLRGSMQLLVPALIFMTNEMDKEVRSLNQLANAACEIAEKYRDTEEDLSSDVT